MPAECHVFGCKHPSVARGLCDTHRKRLARSGTLDTVRPEDWGRREKHPAYRAWCGLRRYHRLSMPDAWREDFWAFVAEVPEKPEGAWVQRPDRQKPWSKDNFFWKTSDSPIAFKEDRRGYMRAWMRRKREHNAEYFKDADLRRNYGVDLAWYRAKFDEQGGVCAICEQPETAVIRGKQISLAVDHCHDTGRVRGLLCRACNNAIGALKHDENLLQKAIAYLRILTHGTHFV